MSVNLESNFRNSEFCQKTNKKRKEISWELLGCIIFFHFLFVFWTRNCFRYLVTFKNLLSSQLHGELFSPSDNGKNYPTWVLCLELINQYKMTLVVYMFTSDGFTWFISRWKDNNCYVKLSKFTKWQLCSSRTIVSDIFKICSALRNSYSVLSLIQITWSRSQLN